MVVTYDAVLYLTKDLTCPGTGVRLWAEGTQPSVVVDLRGHTLRGPGLIEAFGVDGGYWEFDRVTVAVINGRLENWSVAIAGGWEARTTNVALVGNRLGFGCARECAADRTYFARNTQAGLAVGDGGTGGYVTRSTFVDNTIGASAVGLSISGSTFVGNDLGVSAVQVRATRSLFVKNDTAIKILEYNDESLCADLHKVIFVRNTVSLDGQRCAA